MSQPIPDRQSQEQDNLIKDTNISGDLIFAPVQIGTKIETQIVQISAEKVTQQPLIKTSPYQGLKRFNFKDREYFFGRDKLIARLFEAVNRSSLSLVLGASGSGKSSVVRAGLIPELKKSLETNKFYDFIFTPNEDPFESLYRCLLNEEKGYSFSESEAKIALKAEVDTLPEVIRRLKRPEEKWLIFVDQFEQLFISHVLDLEKRNNFIESLVRVANSGDNSVKIILAMRADFLEQLSSYPSLGAIANDNNIHLVTDMHPDELRQAIEQPAAKHGVVFEEGLVEQIIEEVEGQKGYLPLLQYTLDLLWQTECITKASDGRLNIEDRTLNKTSYSALEGVRGALQKRVNEIYSHLNQDEQSATKQIFVKLVDIVDTESGSKTVSRRANRSEFVGETVNNTLQTFIDEKLLVSSAEDLNREKLQISDSKTAKQSATVEIAHEILLSSWDKLKGWLEQEKEAIILKNWLAGETRRWQKIRSEDESKAREELLKGSRLGQAVEFKEEGRFKNIGGLRAEENEFIDASVAETKRLKDEETERDRRDLEAKVALETAEEKNQILADANQKAKQKIKIGSAILLTSLIFAAVVSFLAIRAFKNLQEAQQGTKIERLGASALRQFESGEEITALLLAIQSGQELKAIVKDNRPFHKYPATTPLFFLRTILDNIYEQNEFSGGEGTVNSLRFSPDGQYLAAGRGDGTVQIWFLSGKQKTSLKEHEGHVRSVDFIQKEQLLVTGGDDGTIRLWNLSSGNQVTKFNSQQGVVRSVSFEPNSQRIATAGDDGTVRLWDIQGKPLNKLHDSQYRVFRVIFSPNGKYLAADGDNSTVRIWKSSGEIFNQFETNQREVLNISFSPDSEKIATAGRDGTVKLWDLSGKELPYTRINGFQESVWSVDFSPDGNYLAAAGEEGIVKLWELRSSKQLAQMKADCRIFSVTFNRDGKHLATGGDCGVNLWNIADKQPIQFNSKHSQRGTSIVYASFSPDGEYLATTGKDSTIRLWTPMGKKFTEFTSPQTSISSIIFSPDGKHIATVDNHEDSVILWDLSGNKIANIKGYIATFSSDGKLIAIGGDHPRVYNLSGKLVVPPIDSELYAKTISFNYSGDKIAFGSDKKVEIWNLKGHNLAKFKILQETYSQLENIIFNSDGKHLVTIETGKKNIIVLRNLSGKQLVPEFEGSEANFSPDGKLLAIGGYQNEIVGLYNLSRKLLVTLNPHEKWGNSGIQFSADGQRLVTREGDNTVRIWDLLGRQLAQFRGPIDWIGNVEVAISADGKHIAYTGLEGQVQLWHFEELDELLVRGCNWVGNYLQHNQYVKEKEQHLCYDIGTQK